MRIDRGRIAALALVPALALGLTACGGDDKDGKPSAGASLPPVSGAPSPGGSTATPDGGAPGTGGAPDGRTPGTPRAGGTPSGITAIPTPKAVSQFTACMKRHGINVSPRQTAPPTADQQKLRAATLACVKYLRSPK
ncbi:hypothetical protein BTM25_06060 [Actinomadura rubteroloni]|uniref:Uncharacterized protein n=1 Tax=Actinomadura rubteroloni TaxID=1926885 RepID=A0A2P4UME3_9ACTN|nr:hypothetical protein [Actinomadura rubteroloni]POM26216.1 hypothetical protein BTM25_06060 [Actinomadura rubteroloni]